jgi:hypothetical protein
MLNLKFPRIKISQTQSAFSNRFRVTYEYGWVEPANANNTEVDNTVRTNANSDAFIQCSWNGSVSFYSKQ